MMLLLLLLTLLSALAEARPPSDKGQAAAVVAEPSNEEPAADKSEAKVEFNGRRLKVMDLEGKKELCRLTRRVKFKVVGVLAKGSRLKVKLQIPGCPTYGYIQANLLSGDYSGVPVLEDDLAPVSCGDCDHEERDRTPKDAVDLVKKANPIIEAMAEKSAKNTAQKPELNLNLAKPAYALTPENVPIPAATVRNTATTEPTAEGEASEPVPEVAVEFRGKRLKVMDLADDKELCRLTRRAKFKAVGVLDEGSRLKVKLEIRGCPTYGYVPANLVLGDTSGLAEIEDLQASDDENKTEEEEKNATEGDTPARLNPIAEGMAEMIEMRRAARRTTFTWKQISSQYLKTQERPDLVRLPIYGKKGNGGPCGTFHYNPSNEKHVKGLDAFMTPNAACVFTAVMQEWKEKFCPKGGGCTIQWGDASHGRLGPKQKFKPHSTHRDGTCVDIRPMNEGGFLGTPLKYTDGRYDRKKMKQFVTLLKSKGANNLLFNDTKIGTRKWPKHSDHMHVCFPRTPETIKTCQNLRVDSNVCTNFK